MQTESFADVALGIPKAPFTYRIPEAWTSQLKPGSRVLVPFHQFQKTGYVTRLHQTSSLANIKPITSIFEEDPVLTPILLELCHWISGYYHCSLGEAIENALPKLIRQGRKLKAQETEASQKDLSVPKIFELRLSNEQEIIFKEIEQAFDQKEKKPFLIQGVTGSGKTEIYLRLIAEALQRGKSAICLVPEIALTVRLFEYFRNSLGNHLEILHSKMTDSERFQAWQRIQSGARQVVLGARSSLFSPLSNLGLIIMDEEHENSYKQEEAPRYHARTTAEKLAALTGATFVMGTATPSLESRYSSEEGSYRLLRLDARISEKKLPDIHVIDLKNERTEGGSLLISRPLCYAIEQALLRKDNVILFLNRRGFSTFLLCMDCGETVLCRSCKVSLTYHQSFEKLICHYCNFSTSVPADCPSCHKRNLKFGGLGTERIESVVKKLFPAASVERLDADRVRKRGEAGRILERFSKGEIDILIGTQMLAKGFHFPNVTLVGVINADSILALPDFRAFERGFQLMTQVAGRTGRGEKGGRVFVQTWMPQNQAVQCASKHDYDKFYREEIRSRKELCYPPFWHLANIIIRSKLEVKLQERLLQIEEEEWFLKIRKTESMQLVGPAPLPFYKLRGYFRWHIMIKGKNPESLHPVIDEIVAQLGKGKAIQVAVDMDPVSIL